MGRAPCCDKANVKKGPWSPEEDAKLKAYIEQYGTGGNWIALPQKIGLKRCGKSCRLRWLNYLRPNIKHGGFSEEEDNIICNLYISIGSRWSIIAAQLPGRTDNDIKNYWNTRLKKKLLGRRKQASTNKSPGGSNNGEDSSSPHALSNSALERLQLHMQLQNLQDPFSFYKNPALWPKLHPFQEQWLLQSLSESSNSMVNNPLLQNGLPGTSQEGNLEKVSDYDQLTGAISADRQDHPKFDNSEVDISENASIDSVTNGNTLMASSSMLPLMVNGLKQCDGSTPTVMNFQADLEDFLINNKVSGFTEQEEQIPEFDCFKQMNDAKDSLVWWSNELETKSASSNSWNYELGYNM